MRKDRWTRNVVAMFDDFFVIVIIQTKAYWKDDTRPSSKPEGTRRSLSVTIRCPRVGYLLPPIFRALGGLALFSFQRAG